MRENGSCYPFGRRGGLLAAVACVFAVAVFLRYEAIAQTCDSYYPGCSNWGAVPPCGNTVYCYATEPGWDLTCTNGSQITHYQNSSPPSQWANCQGNDSSVNPQTCADTLQPCGTTLYYAGYDCDPDNQCPISGGLGSVRWCKGPVTPQCAPPP